MGLSKILLLPTYFPTKASPIVGSQIAEQAELLSDEFQIKAIYCLNGMGWKRFIKFITFKLLFRKDGYVSCDDFLLEQKYPVSGVYYYQNGLFPRKWNNWLRCNAYEFVFKSYLKEGWSPDLIHSRGFEVGGIMALYLKKKYNINYVHTENTAFLFDKTFSIHLLSHYKNVLANASTLMFVSTFLMRNTLMHGFINEVPCLVIGNPINEEMFNIQKRNTNSSRSEFTLFSTGYNSFIKDFDTLFKAINILLNLGIKNVKLVIGVTYGGETEIEALKARAILFGIESQVEFVSQIPRNQIATYLNNSDLYVSTSLIETFGIGALEAIFCGVPVVTTANGGVDDFINNLNGIKVALKKPDELAKAILSIINKEFVFDREDIRRNAQSNFSTSVFKSKIRSVYQNTYDEIK